VDKEQVKNNKSSGRNKNLDFVKGWLVIGMVAYHVASYSNIAGHGDYHAITSLLSFISGSWIYISGAIIATYYAEKCIRNWNSVAYRLFTRGIKLLAIFLVLNIILIELGWSSLGKEYSLSTLYRVLVPGTGEASFEILIGISYVLLISPVFLLNMRMGIILALAIIFSELVIFYQGKEVALNHWIMACGAGGFLAGRVITSDWYRNSRLHRIRHAALILTAIIAVALYFYIKLHWHPGSRDIPLYLFGITSILAMTYLSYPLFLGFGTLNFYVDILGRYSLVSYIWQMGLIAALGYLKTGAGMSTPYLVDFTIIMLILLVSIRLLDYVLAKIPLANKSYKWLFG
jgi:hypothetical protein